MGLGRAGHYAVAAAVGPAPFLVAETRGPHEPGVVEQGRGGLSPDMATASSSTRGSGVAPTAGKGRPPEDLAPTPDRWIREPLFRCDVVCRERPGGTYRCYMRLRHQSLQRTAPACAPFRCRGDARFGVEAGHRTWPTRLLVKQSHEIRVAEGVRLPLGDIGRLRRIDTAIPCRPEGCPLWRRGDGTTCQSRRYAGTRSQSSRLGHPSSRASRHSHEPPLSRAGLDAGQPAFARREEVVFLEVDEEQRPAFRTRRVRHLEQYCPR